MSKVIFQKRLTTLHLGNLMSQTANHLGLFKASSSIQILALICTVTLLSGCNTAPNAKQAPQASTQIEALADPFELVSNPVAAGQSRIIFYRPAETTASGASSVHVNGRYHTSLVPGGYSPICIKAGNVELGVRHMNVQTRPNKDGFDSITELTTVSGQSQYVQIQNQNGKAVVLVPVTAQQALNELPTTRLQVHTISRAEATDCVTALEPQPVIPVASNTQNLLPTNDTPNLLPINDAQNLQPANDTQNLQLAGDTLFAFNRSDRAGLTLQGLQAIDLLMNQIHNEFARIDSIHVIGHADPIGDARANEILSTSRAKTIRDYIAMRNDNISRITSEGRGERQLVVTQCGDRQTPASIACNQPNRRVAIEVTGLKR
jgi:OmpA-OmpF porin, OOP family